MNVDILDLRGVEVNHRYVVAVLVSSEVAKSVIDFAPLEDRVMLLKLQTSHSILNIIQMYAPTNNKPEEAFTAVWLKLSKPLKQDDEGKDKKKDESMIPGDLAFCCCVTGISILTHGLHRQNCQILA
ncbi:hypothetical protein HHI36_005192 [Cryptolaemus montrouzieri]|uniref:Uncharacterized protein n=1 Tax=Cryptolaemus montrouzieri TaxID=559131 RepID=A0ABD2NTP3_9CUCU